MNRFPGLWFIGEADETAKTCREHVSGMDDISKERKRTEDGEPLGVHRASERAGGAAVVGIGASAGGLTALREFLDPIPHDSGLSFVVVVHLSPEHESNLAGVLQSSSRIPVVQVTGRTKIEPDCVYVIPPNKNLEITDGHLILSEFEEPRGKRSPIDFFFRTLAEKHPDGIAVLLSGSGTDGTIGMKAVKERGGVLMAQAPQDAEYDQMPRSAIATGLVDFVLPARALAEKLIQIRSSPASVVLPESVDELPDDEEQLLKKILTEVHTRTGHDFTGYKRSMILRRVARRMRVTSTGGLEGYLKFLRGNPAEVQALLKDFLISVTNFFRDPAVFDLLENEVLPKLLDDKGPEEQVRIWTPGCATGEEAYSMAILLLEAADEIGERPEIQIFATDVDEDALGYGREGLYPDAIAADVSDERIERFFTRDGPYFRVSKHLRDHVLFAVHNILKDPPFAKLDLISCRNLLIYLDRRLQEKVIEVFHYALRPGGYLLLGSSESISNTSEMFRLVNKKQRIYQRKSSSPGREIFLPELPLAHLTPRRIRQRPIANYSSVHQELSDRTLHRRALETYAPPSALVDAGGTIIHLSKSAGRFLRLPGGSATLSIVKVIRDELRIQLRAALHDALEQQQSTTTAPVLMQIEGEERSVQLHVRPVPQEDGSHLALVVFADANPARNVDASASGEGGNERVTYLEEELETTKARLQTTIEESETQQEELRATNEELQSINEEYKSTLEELETSKEELQSVNEELKTVNEELKAKVEALSRANNDLKNLMAATEVPTLFLDRTLHIRRFTPPLTKLFNILQVDEGRPLSHVTHKLRYESLTNDVEKVLDTLVPVEREVLDTDDRDYLVRIMPYRTTEDRINGVVLTFVDVTRVKKAEEELRRVQERFALLIRSVKEYAIFLLDEDGVITAWNSGAENLFGYREDEVVGKSCEIVYTEEDRAANVFKSELAAARKDAEAADERWYVRKSGARFWGSGTLTAVMDERGRLHGFAKVLRDNTRRRATALALKKSEGRLRRLNEELEERVEERTEELRKANVRVRQLASDLVKAEQRERQRIAEILHDDLQQRLYGIQMKTAFIRADAEEGIFDDVATHIRDVDAWLLETIERTRELAVDLSPPILRNEGLREAIEWLAAQMNERHGLKIEVNAEQSFSMDDEGIRTLLFQIVRELLFNVVKHAQVDEAAVELYEENGGLVVRVHDHGVGFDVQNVIHSDDNAQGFGLYNVRERLNFVGGRLEIQSRPGEGVTVTVYAPKESHV